MRKLATLVGVVTLSAAGFVVLVAEHAASDTFNVASEVDYRAALIAAGASAAGPHTINITADFSVSTVVDPTYNAGVAADQDLIINGNGHTVTAANTGVQFLFFNSTTTSLTVNNLTVSGFQGDSAINSFGNVFLNNCTFLNNHTTGNGGALNLNASVNDIVVNNCTFDGNIAEDDQGGAIYADDSITITNSTFVNNLAMFSTAAGGAIYSEDGDIAVTNSTFTANTSEGDSAGDGGSAIFNNGGNTTLQYVTIAGNVSPAGGSVLDVVDLSIFGVVISGTTGGGVNCVINGTLTSVGYNFSSDASCAFAGPGDTNSGADPQLGALGANGGPTQTMLPALTSPLVDKVPANSPSAGIDIPTDQRGLTRPAASVTGGVIACDIGAVKLQAEAIVVRFTG